MTHSPYYDAAYAHFASPLYRAIRSEAYGEDLGQNSWTSTAEYRRFFALLDVSRRCHLLDLCCGSGEPSLHLARQTGCSVTGIDSNPEAVKVARALATESPLQSGVMFLEANAGGTLPVADQIFDAVICVDAINHLPDRFAVFREWNRVLKPGGRALFTDPAVVTGLVEEVELAKRSSNGPFVFSVRGENERLLERSGLQLISTEDLTSEIALVAKRRWQARERRQAELVEVETQAVFQRIQAFLETVGQLAAERRLSRVLFTIRRS